MSTTIKAGWLKDNQGNKFAPKTMSSQVINDDGTLLEDSINLELDIIKNTLNDKADETHSHAISDVANLQTTLDGKVPTSRTINGKALSSNIIISAGDVNAYTKTEIDNMEFITTDDIDAICGTDIQAATASEVSF